MRRAGHSADSELSAPKPVSFPNASCSQLLFARKVMRVMGSLFDKKDLIKHKEVSSEVAITIKMVTTRESVFPGQTYFLKPRAQLSTHHLRLPPRAVSVLLKGAPSPVLPSQGHGRSVLANARPASFNACRSLYSLVLVASVRQGTSVICAHVPSLGDFLPV